jgi:hypothetical protein
MTQSVGQQNLNQAQRNNFEITITRKIFKDGEDKLDTEIIKLWAIKVPIVSTSIDSVKIGTPINDFSTPTGGKVTFSDFTITFLMNENFDPYVTIRKWIERNNPFKQKKDYPQKFNPEYQRSVKDWIDRGNIDGERTHNNEWEHIDYRDIIIDLQNLNNITSCKLKYVDCYPTNISGFELSTDSTEAISFTVTFKCLYLDIIGEGGNSLIYC